MELFAQIRRDARIEGLSIRELARRHKVGRGTVRLALAQAVPPPRKTPERSSPKLDPFKPVIDAMLVSDLESWRKQRHTARRVRARLIEEHGATGLSYSTVRDYVRRRRAEIDLAATRRVEAFVPQEHGPGEEAEVDFGDVFVTLAGVKTKCYLFVFRLSHSGKAIHRVYPTQAQEAFLEGHVEAFGLLGGVPTRHIRYDNLSSAVARVLFGTDRRRVENQRWVLFRSHYGFDPFYCQGGVEQEVGWFRRNHLVPMPVADSLAELNERIKAWEELDDARRINDRASTVGQDFERERALLSPLPVEEFDPGLTLTPRVDRSALRRVKAAGFPREKWLADFDFDTNPNVNPATINSLANCEWVKNGLPLCLIGDSGTGKSHLLIGLGVTAAEKGFRVRYTLATRLVNELVEAADEKQLAKTIARYGRVDLLCIDELGYMELDKQGADLLFQVLTEHEETNSVAIASNESFSGWTKTFTDPRLCATIVDRLTYGGNIIETGTHSYRLAQTQNQQRGGSSASRPPGPGSN